MKFSVAKQIDEEMCSIGDLAYVMMEEVEDMTFRQGMLILQEARQISMKTMFHMTEEQMRAFAHDLGKVN